MWVVRIAEGIAAVGAALFILMNIVSAWQRYRQLVETRTRRN